MEKIIGEKFTSFIFFTNIFFFFFLALEIDQNKLWQKTALKKKVAKKFKMATVTAILDVGETPKLFLEAFRPIQRCILSFVKIHRELNMLERPRGKCLRRRRRRSRRKTKVSRGIQ